MIKKILISFILIAASSSLFVSSNLKTTYGYNGTDIEDVVVGDEVTIPEHLISYSGEEKLAEGFKIISPHGSAFNDKTFVANEGGVYSIEYFATFGEKTITEVVEFTCKYTPKDLFTAHGDATVTNASFKYQTYDSNEFKGAKISLKNNGSVTFNKAIDFGVLSSEEEFIKYIAEPTSFFEGDITSLDIKLVDYDNPNNYLLIKNSDGYSSAGLHGSYLTAGANNQYQAGIETFGGNEEWHINSYVGFGRPMELSFIRKQGDIDYYPASIYFDNQTKELYASPTYSFKDKRLVNDLDSPIAYLDNPWSGFTKGKAYLSISCTNLISDSLDIIINNIGGIDLSGPTIIDEKAPELSIDYQGEDYSNLPRAVINKKFPIFPYMVRDDLQDDLDVAISILYEDTANNVLIDVDNNGEYFIPTYLGKYIISYEVMDYFRNKTSKQYSIYCTNIIKDIVIDLEDNLPEQYAYTNVSLPSLDKIVATGGNGHLTISRKIFGPSGEEIVEENNKFFADKIGIYKINYYCEDIVGNHGFKSQSLVVKQINNPMFLDDISLPKYFIKGFSYELPTSRVIYPDGEEIKSGKQIVTVNGENYESDTLLANEDSYNIKFTPGQQDADVNSLTFNVPVIDPFVSGVVDRNKYFYSDSSFDSEETLIGHKFTSTFNELISFANYISLSNLELSFIVSEKDLKQSAGFKVRIANGKQLNKSVDLLFSYDNNVLYIQIDGEKYAFPSSSSTIDGVGYISFNLKYNIHSDKFASGDDKTFTKCKTYNDGTPFNGFSTMIYFSFGYYLANNPSTCYLSKINNQVFYSDLVGDTSGPEFYFEKEFGFIQDYNSNFTLSKTYCFDVLSPIDNDSFTLTVKDPDGNNIFNKVNPTEERQFILDKIGLYQVSYRASDASGNSNRFEGSIQTIEKENPTLKVDYNLKDEYKVNSQIKIPSYAASDNTGNVSVDVILIMPDGQMRLLTHEDRYYDEKYNQKTSYLSEEYYSESFVVDSNTFRLEYAGKYRLRYNAYDEAGNHVMADYIFIAK